MLCIKEGNETSTEKLLLKFLSPSSVYQKKSLQEEKEISPFSHNHSKLESGQFVKRTPCCGLPQK